MQHLPFGRLSSSDQMRVRTSQHRSRNGNGRGRSIGDQRHICMVPRTSSKRSEISRGARVFPGAALTNNSPALGHYRPPRHRPQYGFNAMRRRAQVQLGRLVASLRYRALDLVEERSELTAQV